MKYYLKRLGHQELGSVKNGKAQRGRYIYISKDKNVLDIFPPLSKTVTNDSSIIPIIPLYQKIAKKIYCNYIYHNDKYNVSGGTRNEYRIYCNGALEGKQLLFQPDDILIFRAKKTSSLPKDILGSNDVPEAAVEEANVFFLYRCCDKNSELYRMCKKLVDESNIRGNGHAIYQGIITEVENKINQLCVKNFNEMDTVIEDTVTAKAQSGDIDEMASLFNSVSFRDFVMTGYKQKCAITGNVIQYKSFMNLEIFDEYGSEEVERFGSAVKNVHDVANKLGHFLKPKEMSSIIEKCFIGILSKEFTINCLISFVYTQGAEKLLETSLCQMEDEFMLEILSKIPFSLQLLDVINQVLDDDTAYWEKGAMPYSCYDAEELKIIVEKLVVCKRYVTAVNIIGHSECEAVINAGCIYKLMKLAGTEESIGVETLDDYAVQKIIGWFQQQEDIDLELRSDIEFIYLPMLDDYSEVRPRALNTRLSLEPEYFCSLIELCYKERNGEKREIELNKSLSDRLYEILFQFKVIPGIDWNGNFDAKRFDYWMKTVKTWSRDNDRYEVAMHTVGSGLSYAELDEDKLPQTAVIEELNRVENEELRRGYYLGIINQRGVHWIDPEGKPELELAEDYENRANIAESRGYSRYAGILRVIGDEFKREAKSNILEAKNGDDE